MGLGLGSVVSGQWSVVRVRVRVRVPRGAELRRAEHISLLRIGTSLLVMVRARARARVRATARATARG